MIYSPSSTEDFIRCPVYHRLTRTWEPRGAEWTPYMLLGRAIGDGMSAYYRNLKQGSHAHDPLTVALWVLEEGYVEQETWTLEGLHKHVQKGLQEAINTTPVRGLILMVDEPLGSFSRPDVVFRHPSTGLTVVDTKVKFKLDSRYVGSTLGDYETWWQRFHYAWEVGELLQEPVEWIGAHLIALNPKVRGMYHPIEVSEARVRFWLRQAEPVWERMEVAITKPLTELEPNWNSCRTRYGLCPFFDACHRLDLDTDRMAIVYQPKRCESPTPLSRVGENA